MTSPSRTMTADEPETHPVQVLRGSEPARAPQVVTMRAYEVYCALHGEQRALIEGECRGGFSAGELVAFLYARSFPKPEWEARANEAFRGMRMRFYR